jgi:hypothetical protein
MNAILQQTLRARTRLLLQRFGRSFSWSLFLGLFLASLGLFWVKIWHIEFHQGVWVASWLVGGCALAIIAAGVAAFWGGPTRQHAAREIDRRFGLKERVSSALLLDLDEQDTPAGKALLADAEKRVSNLEMHEQFPLRMHPRGLLPLLPLAIVGILYLVPNAEKPNPAIAKKQSETTQVKAASDQLKKQLEQRRRAAEAKGLEEMDDMYKQIAAGLDKLTQSSAMERKDALIKLNELKDELEKKRDRLGSTEQTKQNLKSLKDLEQGPADKVARQLEKGNFGQAGEELKVLAKQVKEGNLTPEQQKQLEKQMEKLQKQVEQTIAQHKQAKEELEKQIEQAKQEGNLNQASKLQEKLNQLKKKDPSMEQLQKLATCVNGACEKMQNGDKNGAAAEMEQLADQLGEMQTELDELQDLEGAIDQFDQAKQGMCDENNAGDRFAESDFSKGRGPGSGWRDIEENETSSYQSQVRGNPGPGKSVASGFASGPNRKGATQADVQAAIQAGLFEKSDPVEDRPLPKNQRDHTRSYFDSLRDGNP